MTRCTRLPTHRPVWHAQLGEDCQCRHSAHQGLSSSNWVCRSSRSLWCTTCSIAATTGNNFKLSISVFVCKFRELVIVQVTWISIRLGLLILRLSSFLLRLFWNKFECWNHLTFLADQFTLGRISQHGSAPALSSAVDSLGKPSVVYVQEDNVPSDVPPWCSEKTLFLFCDG